MRRKRSPRANHDKKQLTALKNEIVSAPLMVSDEYARILTAAFESSNGVFNPAQAFEEAVEGLHGSELTLPPEMSMVQIGFSEPSRNEPVEPIVIIPVHGYIRHHRSPFDWWDILTSVDKMSQEFRQADANDDVDTIIMHFDSGGGSATGVDEFAKVIREADTKTIAVINPQANSSAYYLASQCDEVVITPTGMCGNIGVIWHFQFNNRMLEEAGIDEQFIRKPEAKSEGWEGKFSGEGLAH